MDLYGLANSISGEDLFKYAAVAILLLLLFKSNVFIAFFLVFIYFSYNYSKIKTARSSPEQQKKVKLKTIKPPPITFDDKGDIVDFLFSIQDFHSYNPLAYEEMMNNLDIFFSLYSEINNGTKFCDQYYQIAKSKKENALNALHSMIFTLPTDRVMTDKFNRAHKRLNTILTKYLDELYGVCKLSLIKNGYNMYRTALNTGPEEYNKYDNKDFTYKIY